MSEVRYERHRRNALKSSGQLGDHIGNLGTPQLDKSLKVAEISAALAVAASNVMLAEHMRVSNALVFLNAYNGCTEKDVTPEEMHRIKLAEDVIKDGLL